LARKAKISEKLTEKKTRAGKEEKKAVTCTYQ